MAVGVSIVSTFDASGIYKAIRDFKKLETVSAKASFSMRTIDKAVTNGVKNVAKYGGAAAAGLGFMAFKLAKTAEDAQVADRAMLQVATSMGLFGAQTQQVVNRLTELASAQQMQLGVDEDVIKATQTKLLTFKNLAATADEVGSSFDRATMAALDLAAAGFGEAAQNATQLGKALQDPIKGITALARAGVTFTEQEKAKIAALTRSGKILEAQDELLKAIEGQVGGTAKASAKATDRIALAFGEVAESLGSVLLPYFERLATFVETTVVPYMEELAKVIGEDGLGAAIKIVGGDILEFIGNMGALGNTVYGLVAAFIALKAATMAYNVVIGLATALGIAFNAANPFAWIAAAIAVVVVAIIAMYVKFQWFRDGVNAIINAIIASLESWINLFIKINNTILDVFNVLIRAANMFGADIAEIGPIAEVSFGRVGAAADKTKRAIGAMGDRMTALAASFGVAGSSADDSKNKFSGVGATVKTVADKLKDYREAVLKTVDANKSLADATQGVLDAQQKVIDAGNDITDSLRKLDKAGRDVTKAIAGVAKAQENTAQAQTDYRKSVDATVKAQTKLSTATLEVQKAQDAFNQAVNGYGASSKQGKDAQRTLSEAQRDAERSTYDAEKAQYDLIAAEAELAAVRSDATSTPQLIREAEIALAEAKLDLIEAQIDQTDSQVAVTDATDKYDQMLNGVKADSEIYKDLLDQLNEAKATEQAAIEGVTEARIAEQDALKGIAEALDAEAEAAQGVEDAKYAQAEAERDLEKAYRDEAAAIRDVADAQLAEAKAILAVADAQKELNTAKKNAPAAGVAKIDKALATAVSLASAAVTTSAASMAQFRAGDIRYMAEGGIVTSPTAAIIGERGPEAVIPLDRAGGFGTTIMLTVNAGMGANGAEIGQVIIDAIKQTERRSGKVFAAA
jgi:hypothetical protein